MADVGTVGVVGLDRLDQADPRPHEQRFHRRHAGVQRLGELGVGHSVHLAHEQCRALLVGQPADVPDQTLELFALLGLEQRVVQRRARDLEDVGRSGHGAAEVVDAAVVRNAVQPRPQRDRPLVGAQRAVRPQEDVLEHVLGVAARAAEHLARVGEQPLAVPIVDRPERVVVAGPEQRDELVVGAQRQQSTGDRCSVQARRR